MAKYKLWVEVEMESGSLHPSSPKVKWAARRLVPPADLGGWQLHLPSAPTVELGRRDWLPRSRASDLPSAPTVDDGVRMAINAMRDDADSRGEALSYDDIEADVQHVTVVVKREGLAVSRDLMIAAWRWTLAYVVSVVTRRVVHTGRFWVLKRRKAVVRRTSSTTFAQSLFDEVMARPGKLS